uniref:Putative DNA repair protein n=1 Tax=Trypanosoma vivax (strain Y486) TaxID=1055687 RepID=G0UC41_TRYVY|nr:putative DNA repair protein, fragment [Trypanosoma vivax Y486]
MWHCRRLFVRKTHPFLNIKRSTSTEEHSTLHNFYSSLEYHGLGTLDVPELCVPLFSFQKEGIYWMMLRERDHVGGIMADHLGMGKTIQMIGLCLCSFRCNKVVYDNHIQKIHLRAQEHRLLTVIRQLQRINVVANCSRINRPASDLRSLLRRVEEVSTGNSERDTSDRRGPVMLRNGKMEVLVELPPKTENVVMKKFSLHESKQYNDILSRSKSALEISAHKEGTFHIFAILTRLRQACCHPWISGGKALTVSICEICKSESVGTVTSKCGHHFCYECLLLRFRDAVGGDDMAVRIPCPTCGGTITKNSVFKNNTLSSAERIAKFKKLEMEMSTKLKMILNCIQTMKVEYPNDKMIIFSHFTSFMDVISVALDNACIPHLRLDGTMSLSSRNIVIQHFQTSDDVRIILASKTATGIGLNLTAANHVLVVDPWWNPAIEEQAVHRCYRIGQRKHVYVTRIIIEDTIEQYCHEICKRKKEFGDAILRAATKGGTGASLASSRLRELVSRLHYVNEGGKSNNDDNQEDGTIVL